jgi:ABC-2 type transport system ATP-binding protein
MLLAVESLSHRYKDRLALDGFDLHLNRREILGLAGPNGSGKSTLLRILSTIVKPQSGRVEICGYDARKHPGAIRERIAVVFQSSTLDKLLTVEENLAAAGSFYGLTGRALQSRITESLRLFQLSERAQDRAATLSGGLQRRVELARAFLHQPQLLLLDEPSSGLDPSSRDDLWRALEQVRSASNTAVILSTHLYDEAEKCDTLCFLSAGRRLAEGSPRELRARVPAQVIRVRPKDIGQALASLGDRQVSSHEGCLYLEIENAAAHLPALAAELAGNFEELALVQPTLADLYRKLNASQRSPMWAASTHS